MNDLEEKLKAAVLASAVTENEGLKVREGGARRALKWTAPAVAAAAAAALLLLPDSPKDTFDDPALAYAEVEKAFAYMSQKIEEGTDIAAKAEEPVEMLRTVFK